LFLGVSAALLLFGGAVHTLAFKKAVAAVAASDLAPFFGKALKGLWLIDSTMLITLAIVFGLIAVQPVMASSVVVALLTLMPAVVAILLYCFIGAIMPAHLLVVAAALGFAAALLRTKT
jgi:histidine ammonia-lyase